MNTLSALADRQVREAGEMSMTRNLVKQLLVLAATTVVIALQSACQSPLGSAIGGTPSVAAVNAISQAATPHPAAVFEGDTTTLLVPEGYREWVFVGSSLGL